MDSLVIDTGEKRIAINNDPERLIVFNPQDVVFVEKFYGLLARFETRVAQYKKQAEKLESVQELDSQGLPVNSSERLSFLRESCLYIREEIDTVFGAGTSQKAFGDALVLDAFTQFFNGITPFVKAARAEKVEKYTDKTHKKRK